jgi:hypothetical protein
MKTLNFWRSRRETEINSEIRWYNDGSRIRSNEIQNLSYNNKQPEV